MAKQTIEKLKSWFVTLAKPTQQQFWDWLDSFRHKDEKIGSADLDNQLTQVIQNLPDASSVSGLNAQVHAHIQDMNNPHQVTKDQIGLDLVDNTSDQYKPISNAVAEALNSKADLDEDGKVLSSQLPETPTIDKVLTAGNSTTNQLVLTGSDNSMNVVNRYGLSLYSTDNSGDADYGSSAWSLRKTNGNVSVHAEASNGGYVSVSNATTQTAITSASLNFYAFGVGSLKVLSPTFSPNQNYTQTFQNKSGTIALLSDITATNIPTLQQVANSGNLFPAGTISKAPFILSKGSLVTTPQAGSVEYDGTGLYITLQDNTRKNLLSTDRVFKVYPHDYDANTKKQFSLIGWDTIYRYSWEDSQALRGVIDIEITLTSGTPAGTVIKAIFEGVEIYKLTVLETLLNEAYVIGTAQINQDVKYTNMFYIRNAVEEISANGILNSRNSAFRLSSSFVTPTLELSIQGSWARIGATYTVDKQQIGRSIYIPK